MLRTVNKTTQTHQFPPKCTILSKSQKIFTLHPLVATAWPVATPPPVSPTNTTLHITDISWNSLQTSVCCCCSVSLLVCWNLITALSLLMIRRRASDDVTLLSADTAFNASFKCAWLRSYCFCWKKTALSPSNAWHSQILSPALKTLRRIHKLHSSQRLWQTLGIYYMQRTLKLI